jgi:hypothetical protein
VNIHNRARSETREKSGRGYTMRGTRCEIRDTGYEISRIPHLELRVALIPLVSPVSHESDIEERRRIRWNERE